MASSEFQLTDPPTRGYEMAVYPSAILLATFSFLVVLLIVPPMFWHLRNRNTGATAIIAWMIILNFQTFVNALIWPTDDLSNWFNGTGLCDVEVKIQVASQVAAPAALGCVLRALAQVLDTERATLVQTKAQRMRNCVLDLLWCIGFPLLQMLAHYIVQPHRYYIFGISGCIPAVSSSWLTILLLYTPPLIWTVIDAYYALLILVRLYRYRLTFSAILESNNTTKSRFMRLYILCLTWILVFVPTEAVLFYRNLSLARFPFSWSETHNTTAWNEIIMVPSGGSIVYDRYIWLGCAILLFVFFGVGREALTMYRTGLLAMGLGRVFPILKPDRRRTDLMMGTTRSMGSMARLLFKRKSSSLTGRSESVGSQPTSITESMSPRKTIPLETIKEDEGATEKPAGSDAPSTRTKQPAVTDAEKNAPVRAVTSSISRFISILTRQKGNAQCNGEQLPLGSITGQPSTIRSEVSAGQVSPTMSNCTQPSSNYCGVIVRREIKQGIETLKTLPVTAYPAV